MKVVILAGGFGTRISEESHLKPKPMIEIGNDPILIHIMKYYSSFGFNEFIVCLGYKGYVIKEYFQNLYLHQSDVTYDFNSKGKVTYFNTKTYPWKVTLIDTGLNTMTGGRIKRIKDFINEDTFMLTYGDGLSNVNIEELLSFHIRQKKILTITTVNPDGRFGILEFNNNLITSFVEKPKEGNGWVNGGFMVASSKIFEFIENDETIFEKQTMKILLNKLEITGFKHYGFWQPMDTLRDKNILDTLFESGKAPWIK